MCLKVKQWMPHFTFKFCTICVSILPVWGQKCGDWKFFLLHDSARPHTAAIIRQFLAKKEVARLSHPPYSSDLSRPPSNYFTFPISKLELKRDHYASIENFQKSVTAKLKASPISDFARAMKRLEDRTNECIRVSGDYFK